MGRRDYDEIVVDKEWLKQITKILAVIQKIHITKPSQHCCMELFKEFDRLQEISIACAQKLDIIYKKRGGKHVNP